MFLCLLLSEYYGIIMCLHPIIGYDNLDRTIECTKYQHELDNCDYFELTNPIDALHGDLLVIQLNIRGLLGKLSNLKDLVNKASRGKSIDIILLCETWQNKNSPPINLPGYNYIHKTRKHKLGGGVGIFVSNRIRFTEVKLQFTYECIEQILIKITTKNDNKTIMVGSLYRPPYTNDTKFVEEYNNLLLEIQNHSKKIILGMDHNMDFLKHSVHKRTQEFIELNLDNNLTPTITRPTRITKSTATLIDNIIPSQSLLTNSDSRIIIDDISDHLPSLVKFRDLLQKNNSVKTITSRNLCEKNIERIKNDLQITDWSAVITENVDKALDSFHDLLINTVNKHSPIITRKIGHNRFRKEPWVSASILRSINTQKKLYAKSIKSNASTRDMIKYKNYKKILDRLKRISKISYYQTKCVEFKNNIKKLWELINKVIGKTSDKGSIITYIKVNEIDILNEKEIANEFGKYFALVGKTFVGKVIPPKHINLYYINKIVRNPKTIYMHCTTESEIEKLISKLPNKTSSGYDNLSNVLIKKLGTILTKPLSLIFNKEYFQTR